MNEEIENDRKVYIEKAEAVLSNYIYNDSEFYIRLEDGIRFKGIHNHARVANTINLLRSSAMISSSTFEAMISGGRSYKPMFVHEMWEALVRTKVFVRQFSGDRGDAELADHMIDRHRLLNHLLDSTFVNLFHPPSWLHARYAQAVVAIDVMLQNEDLARGSGFVVRMDDTERRWLFTCLHNVDPTKVTVKGIMSATGLPIEVGPPLLSTRYDFAIFPVSTALHGPILVLKEGGSVFDDVYTLGFPGVPRSEAGMLGHRGEINARVDVVSDGHPALVISNLVSPGSSGGPVLDREGRCIGMSIRWLEGEWGGERARFSAALPANVLIDEFKLLSGVVA
jgi:hypothetical protein